MEEGEAALRTRINEGQYPLLLGCQRHFEALVSDLIDRSDDPNFLEAAVGVT